MATEFARHTYIDDIIGIPSEQRLALSVNEPGNVAAMPPGRVGTITKNRIRYALAELANGNSTKVSGWLDELAKDSPKAALEMFIELCKFSTPQMKAALIEMRSETGTPRAMSHADLERLVSGGDEEQP